MVRALPAVRAFLMATAMGSCSGACLMNRIVRYNVSVETLDTKDSNPIGPMRGGSEYARKATLAGVRWTLKVETTDLHLI